MSHRPIEEKKRRRIAKSLRRVDLPRRFDLVEWLVSRGHAGTKRAARELILSGRVKANSHTLGIITVPDGKGGEEDVVSPLIDAALRSDVMVLSE
jgi:hypothetical protein